MFIGDDVDAKGLVELLVPSAPFYELITDSRQEAQLIKCSIKEDCNLFRQHEVEGNHVNRADFNPADDDPIMMMNCRSFERRRIS